MNPQKFFLSFFLIAAVLGEWPFAQKPRISPATFSPDGQYLVFHTDHKEGRIICRVRKDGTQLTQLTPSGEDSFDPAYSPDGSKIVFARTPSGKFGEQSDLYIMNSDGSNQSRLTSGPALDIDPVFSPDGQRIYFVRARWFGRHSPLVSSSWKDKDIYAIDIDGSNLTAITDEWYYKMSRPSISPDGKQALVHLAIYENPDSLWIFPIEDPKVMRPVRPNLEKHYLTIDLVRRAWHLGMPYQDLYDPQFSPDGKSILFTWAASTSNRGYYEYEIYFMDLEDKNIRRVTNLKRHSTSPSFSPDGKQIVFLFNPKWPKHSSNELWVVNSDGTNPRRIDIKL